MDREKNIAIERRYLVPFLLVGILFLLWGLANNMTDTLLAAFKKIMSMSDTQTSLIQFAFYGAYFCFAFPAALFIRRYSYRSGILLGLLFYALGTILFLPAANTESYAFYLAAIYIMAGGCSILETTANPYVLSMGRPETATRRLNIAQALNPIGSITGLSLHSVSGTYASLGVVLLILLVVMYFVKMPEGKDTGTQGRLSSTFSRLMKNRKYRLGVVAQFFYVGAQICVWSFTIRLVMAEMSVSEAKASNIYLASIICFCLGRFFFTWLMKFVSPLRLLAVAALCDALLAAVAVLFHGTAVIIALIGISFFMSLMFPTIYGIALEGVEDASTGGQAGDAKIGACGLIMAILGGALLTPLQGMTSDKWGVNMSYLIPLGCFAIILCYARYVAHTNTTRCEGLHGTSC